MLIFKAFISQNNQTLNAELHPKLMLARQVLLKGKHTETQLKGNICTWSPDIPRD